MQPSPLASASTAKQPLSDRLARLIEQLKHVLPMQAPLQDFVHHNTLHGFEHLPFAEALYQASALTGYRTYLPLARYREYYQNGRIERADLDAVLNSMPELAAEQTVLALTDNSFIKQADIYRIALISPLHSLSARQLIWQWEEEQALSRFQRDVHVTAREQLLARANAYGLSTEAATIEDLWQACLHVLKLEPSPLHPEALVMLTAEQVCALLGQTLTDGQSYFKLAVKQSAYHLLDELLAQVGEQLTLRGVLKQLLGEDILDDIRPLLLRPLSLWLDQGLSPLATSLEKTGYSGFYQWWKTLATHDLSPALKGLPDWQEHLDSLPDDAVATIAAELRRMGIPEAQWEAYLQRLALDLPGWSGMVLWRDQHPDYQGWCHPVSMLDYLAVRLVLEHVMARHYSRQYWLIDANLPALRGHFHAHPDEFLVRYQSINAELPEFIRVLIQPLANTKQEGGVVNQAPYQQRAWQQLAQTTWLWLNVNTDHAAHNEASRAHTSFEQAWRLFRLAQHLGLDGAIIRPLSLAQIEQLFGCLTRLTEQQSAYIYLQAYERHYRESLYSAIIGHHQQGTWAHREQRPRAQLIFCMDDREEGFRRHLEELDSQIETLGAAAFFNLPMNWQGIDDAKPIKLCPLPVTPVHLVQETVATQEQQTLIQHTKRRQQRWYWLNGLHQWTRSSLLKSTLGLVVAPAALGVMLGKALMPLKFGQWAQGLRLSFEGVVPTYVQGTAEQLNPECSASQNQLGFTDQEQAALIAQFLQANGLVSGFSRLIVLMGHYSTNQNNPHQAAYGCGACSGRYSGPNARTFAAMANRDRVRELLRHEYQLEIPADSWFMGAEHDTCTEALRWQDVDKLPEALQAEFKSLQTTLNTAAQYSAHERCRKLASAPKNPSLKAAAHHIAARGMDYSQPRPELGHATNAVAFIGRRAMSQGLFLDRRAFLISYDCRIDPEGQLLEQLLLTVAPVGAGINLEYYFSTVANDEYGSGSKITHNLMGLLGVMEGCSSDLRTGLPRQMIEIHEPMRLHVVIEAERAVVEAIYQRQAALRRLIGNQWILLAVKPLNEAAIYHFEPSNGFVRWSGPSENLPVVSRSQQWYQGHSSHLPPAQIKQPVKTHA